MMTERPPRPPEWPDEPAREPAHTPGRGRRPVPQSLPKRRRVRRRVIVDRPRERRSDTADVLWRTGITLAFAVAWFVALFLLIDHPGWRTPLHMSLLVIAKVAILSMIGGVVLTWRSWNRSRWGRGV